jgi:hypothetical protein
MRGFEFEDAAPTYRAVLVVAVEGAEVAMIMNHDRRSMPLLLNAKRHSVHRSKVAFVRLDDTRQIDNDERHPLSGDIPCRNHDAMNS